MASNTNTKTETTDPNTPADTGDQATEPDAQAAAGHVHQYKLIVGTDGKPRATAQGNVRCQCGATRYQANSPATTTG